MDSSQALDGFEKEITFVGDSTLKVNRLNKLTLPGESLRISGIRLPRQGVPTEQAERDNLENAVETPTSEVIMESGDLEIFFELMPEEEELELLRSDEAKAEGEASAGITVDLDASDTDAPPTDSVADSDQTASLDRKKLNVRMNRSLLAALGLKRQGQGPEPREKEEEDGDPL